ncbi:MAG: tetratricopeptide repeat protein [Candidatus Eiseniibacteriota bacterium]|jgi:tetratricopeptide (TPR) repeat protein
MTARRRRGDERRGAGNAASGRPPRDARRRASDRGRRRRSTGGRGWLEPGAPWLAALALLVLVLVAYLPVLLHATYVWDDARYVIDNPTLRSVEGLGRIWTEIGATIQYYPLVFTTFWVEYQLWGLAPTGFHLVNILLHALGALLLWRVLRHLDLRVAWIGAALFALHPMQVESVAWIAERKNVLSGALYMGALLAYLRFAMPQGRGGAGLDAPSAPRRDRWWLYALSLLLFVLAMTAKTVVCSLPAVIVLVLWWQRVLDRRHLLQLAPMFLVGAGLGLLTIWMEKHSVQAVGAAWELTLAERVLIAGRALWFYAGKLLVPRPLSFNYVRWAIDSGAWWQWLFPLGWLALLAVLAALGRRLGRAPLVAGLVFTGTLFPALGFIDVYPMRYAFVADHFQYLAGVALLVPLAAVLDRWLGRPAGGALRRHGWAVPVLALLVVLTMQRGTAFRDRETLWRDTLRKNPDSFLAHCNLGGLLLEQGHREEALAHLERAVRLEPDMHEAHGSLGKTLVELGRIDEGIVQYREAIALKPEMAWAHQALGSAQAAAGRHEAALDCFERAREIDPGLAGIDYNLGTALARLGRLDAARTAFYAALAGHPDDPRTHLNLANVLVESEELEDAIAHYREAIRLAPDYGAAHRNLALTLARTGDSQGAIDHFWLALRADTGDVVAHFELARLLERTGRTDGAITEYRRTLALDPEHAGARQALIELTGSDALPETAGAAAPPPGTSP